MINDKYFDEWDENSPISWWNQGRKKLNVIIRMVNGWTLNDCPQDESAKLLKQIDMGLQTFAAQDGGSGWVEPLTELKAYITSKIAE